MRWKTDTLVKTPGAIGQINSALSGRKTCKCSLSLQDGWGRAVNVHTEGEKRSFPEKGVPGDAVEQVIGFPLGRLSQ